MLVSITAEIVIIPRIILSGLIQIATCIFLMSLQVGEEAKVSLRQ